MGEDTHSRIHSLFDDKTRKAMAQRVGAGEVNKFQRSPGTHHINVARNRLFLFILAGLILLVGVTWGFVR